MFGVLVCFGDSLWESQMTEKKPVLLHHHLFKNAGTSIEAALRRHFGEQWRRLDGPLSENRILAVDVQRFLSHLPQTQAISSHQLSPADAPRSMLSLCLLRDPLDRLFSMYLFLNKDQRNGHVLAEQANSQGLGGFVSWMIRSVPSQVESPQARFLAGELGFRSPPGRDTLRRAQRSLAGCLVLGTVDRLRDSLSCGEHYLGEYFPGLRLGGFHLNSTSAIATCNRWHQIAESCGLSDFKILRKKLQLDEELLSFARCELEQRLARVPVPQPEEERSGYAQPDSLDSSSISGSRSAPPVIPWRSQS